MSALCNMYRCMYMDMHLPTRLFAAHFQQDLSPCGCPPDTPAPPSCHASPSPSTQPARRCGGLGKGCCETAICFVFVGRLLHSDRHSLIKRGGGKETRWQHRLHQLGSTMRANCFCLVSRRSVSVCVCAGCACLNEGLCLCVFACVPEVTRGREAGVRTEEQGYLQHRCQAGG